MDKQTVEKRTKKSVWWIGTWTLKRDGDTRRPPPPLLLHKKKKKKEDRKQSSHCEDKYLSRLLVPRSLLKRQKESEPSCFWDSPQTWPGTICKEQKKEQERPDKHISWCFFDICRWTLGLRPHLWWATALLARTTRVKVANARLWTDWPARAKPAHSVISPRKLAPDTYSNIPPVGGRRGAHSSTSKYSSNSWVHNRLGNVLLFLPPKYGSYF